MAKATKKPVQRIDIRLPKHMHQRVKRLADARGEPINQYIRALIWRHLEDIKAARAAGEGV